MLTRLLSRVGARSMARLPGQPRGATSRAAKAARLAGPLAAGVPLLTAAGVSWAGSQALVRPAPGRPRPRITASPIPADDAPRLPADLAGWLPAPLAALRVGGAVRLDRAAPPLLRLDVGEGASLLLVDPAAASRESQRPEVLAGPAEASPAPDGPDRLVRVVLGGSAPDGPVRGLMDSYLFDTPAHAGLAGGPLRVALPGIGWVAGWVAGPPAVPVTETSASAHPAARPGGGTDRAVADSPLWAVFAHGRRAGLAQGLRLARGLAAAGVPTVALPHYAGDDPDGRRSGLGEAEWPQVERALRWALAAGAERVVLAGASMGAAVITALLRRSDLAPAVAGLVFDSPVLDWSTVVRAAARSRGLPAAVAAPVMALSAWRAGLDWDDVSLLADPPREPLPTLVLHGSADTVTPLSSSRRLADLVPDRVRLEVFDGAEHVQSYNTDPQRYESVVAAFARRIADGADAAPRSSRLR